MQVNFTGIYRADIPNYSTVQIPIKNRYEKAKHFENVLNKVEDNTYTESETKRIKLFAKKTLADYKEPMEGKDNKAAGIYRLPTRDAIYYCTGVDIELAKQKKEEIKNHTIEQKTAEMKKFIKERQEESSFGFVVLNSSTGERYDILGMGSNKPNSNTFICDFVYL